MSRLGQIKQTFKSVRIEIKAFLRRQQWKEALIFFCFILLAFGFWLLQSLQQEYEIDIRIPVKYKNVPPDISFTETPPFVIIASLKSRSPVIVSGIFLNRCNRFCLCSLDISFTFVSGSMPDNAIITGIIFAGSKCPREFLNCLFFISSNSLKIR